MIRFNKIYPLLSILLVLTSCEREDIESVDTVEYPMLFGVEQITQTKVSYEDQYSDEDTATFEGVAARFDVGDNVGLYAFYNNYYYWYNDYGCFAESVIFANHGMVVGEDNMLDYSPIRSWTFSTLYGTAPHTIDVMAYYPLVDGYYPEQIAMINDETGAATFEYYYFYNKTSTTTDDQGETTTTSRVVNSDVDFMTAHTRYDEYEDRATDFREAMLEKATIPLEFTRQLASLNLQVTKPDGYATDIIVTGLTFYFDAYEKFTQTISSSDVVKWDGMTEGYSLTATVSDLEVTLNQTGWSDIPSDGATNEGVANLLTAKQMPFFPPDAEIWKVIFTITDGGEAKTYTWHPHITTIEANRHYTLSLELDPARAN